MDAEQFISVSMRGKFDYTKWQKKRFDDIQSADFNDKAVSYARENPFEK